MVHTLQARTAIGPAAALLLSAASVWLPAPARAADLVGTCCADLEERIADLEATAARKGNRKVSLTVIGQVNRAVLLWDDGVEDNAYSAGNKNDQTNFSFLGDAGIAKGWTAGYELTVRVEDNLSDAVDQNSGGSNASSFQLWKAHWYIESESLGRLAVGKESRVSDTAPETDFSDAGVAGYAGVQDVGGGFLLRRADGGLAGLAWGDLGNHMNGDTANLVRWDSPELAGFVVSASWGEDDIWDAGIRYAGEGGGFRYEAVVAYTEITDAPRDFADVDNATVVGSASIIHDASGLNATVAAGHREFDATASDEDGVARTPADQRFVYAKLGWLAKLNGLGPTAFYGEYGWFKDYVSAGADADTVASFTGGAANAGCANAAAACRISGSELEVWGAGVVQHIEEAEMQLYLGYRRHTADVALEASTGAGADAAALEDFDTVITGAKIGF